MLSHRYRPAVAAAASAAAAACGAEIYFAAAGDFSKPLHFYQVFQATSYGSEWTRRVIEGPGVANTVESTSFGAAIQFI